MRKILALLLSVGILLTSAIGVAAYSDVPEGTYVSEAVTILSNLDILNGFEDNTFKPNDYVTRAQMAKIICHMLNYKDVAASTTNFTDVPSNHWASGYINIANGLGIVAGYGDGKFGPEDKVTYEQAVKMVVCALGYEPIADANGGWYAGYTTVAASLGILSRVDGNANTPIKRGAIACLVYNALEIQIMDQDGWYADQKQNKYVKTDDTILSKYLKVNKWEGIVSNIPYMNDIDDTPFINLANASYKEYVNGTQKAVKETFPKVDASLIPNINSYLGKKVVAYVGTEEDDDTDNIMVYALAEKKNSNETFIISVKDIVKEDVAQGIVYYLDKNEDEQKLYFDYDNTVYVNYNKVTSYRRLADLAPAGGLIAFISNDSNKEYNTAIITAYTSETVVDRVVKDDDIIVFEPKYGDAIEIDTRDKDIYFEVYRDGKAATLNDIKANDTITVVERDDTFQIFYVSSKTITGTVDGKDDEYVTIGRNDYKVSDFYNGGRTSSFEFSDDSIFYLNSNKEIAFYEVTKASTDRYGLVTAVGAETTFGETTYKVAVTLANGKQGTYELAEKVRYDNIVGDAEVAAELAGVHALTTYKNITDLYESMYIITIRSDNKISKFQYVAPEIKVTGKEYDAETMTYGPAVFDRNTIVFAIAPDYQKNTDITVGKISSYMIDGEGKDMVIYTYNHDNYTDVANVVVGYNMDKTIEMNSGAVVISTVSTALVPGTSDQGIRIKGMKDGKEVSYILYDEDKDIPDAKKLNSGDIIMIGAEHNGIVSEIKWLFDLNTGETMANFANLPESAFKQINLIGETDKYVYGVLDKSKDVTDRKFYLTAASETASEDGELFKNSANYILVDMTMKKPEIINKSKSTIFSTTKRYDYKVFMRYYDDVLIDVIVYKYDIAE